MREKKSKRERGNETKIKGVKNGEEKANQRKGFKEWCVQVREVERTRAPGAECGALSH